jgi:eukaryotic-like serine/threonine-protein kinase
MDGGHQAEQTFIEGTIQATYHQLDCCLDAARRLVPVVDAGQLTSLLPQTSPEAQRFILGELIKLDMRAAAKAGSIRTLDFYFPACLPWFETSELPVDLILEEIQVRRASGERPSLGEYQRRFAHWSEALAEFQWEETIPSTRAKHYQLPPLAIGDRIDDFTIVRSLGRGAFAQVYLARQESMQRLVALKISCRGSEEPQTLSRLDHQAIVRVFDQRWLPDLGIHLLYMQLIPGGTLAGVIRATRDQSLDDLDGCRLLEIIDQALLEIDQQPPERGVEPLESMNWAATVAWLGVQLAEGLTEAHHKNVLHRDVKPANILLAASGTPKLADFNVSDRGMDATGNGPIGGTLAYMSPEHLMAAHQDPDTRNPPDHRSDLYSLCLVIWELWQGALPWRTDSQVESWQEAFQVQVRSRHREFNLRRSDDSPEGRWLEKVLRHSLHPDPVNRPQSCRELATRLRLAHHPELAKRFAPSRNSIVERLLRLPVLIVTGLVVFATNGPAGFINYTYNEAVIISKYDQLLPAFRNGSTLLNAIAFPLGGLLLILFAGRVERSLRKARSGQSVTPEEIDWTWRFGHRAAAICGGLWLIFGILFPVTMLAYEPDLSASDFVHFFMSLAICGGMALIYPFFGISLLSTYLYYPQLQSNTMQDEAYFERSRWLRRQSDRYLTFAAVVPLLAIGLLIVMESNAPVGLQVALVAITLVSLIVSFKAHQWISVATDQYAVIFQPQTSESRPRFKAGLRSPNG